MDEKNIANSFDVFPSKDYKVRFEGGPYDGREGTLPFLPTFLVLREMDGDWGKTEDGKFVMDTRLSRYVYMLTFEQIEPESEAPVVYVFRPRVDVRDFFRYP